VSHPRRARGWFGVGAMALLGAVAALGSATELALRPADPGRAVAEVTATTASEPDLLERELVDVALLRPASPGGDPRLLTLAHEVAPTEQYRLTILDRGIGRWQPMAEAISPPPDPERTDAPWLVAIDHRRFVLVMVVPAFGETWLRTVDWTGEELRLGEPAVVRRAIDDAGTADVDGDGADELVLVEAATRRRGPLCQGSNLVVVDPATLAVRTEVAVPNLRLGPAVIGRLDDVAGDDLATVAQRNCPAGPSAAFRLAVAAVRLTDGRVLHERTLPAADSLTAWAGRPSLVDIQRDGRPELLVGAADGLLVLSPHREWEVRELVALPGVLVGVRTTAQREPMRPPGASVAVVTMDEDGVQAGEIRRTREGWAVVVTGRLSAADVGQARWTAAELDRRNASLRLRGGTAWLTGRPDCPALVVPLAVLPCADGTGGGPPIEGPAWLATRPLADVAHGDRILVARSDRWAGLPGRLTAPAPLAAEPAGQSLRHGPSSPFRLAEVAATALSSSRVRAPILAAEAEGDPPRLRATAMPDVRVLVAVLPDARGVRSVNLIGLLARSGRDEPEIRLQTIAGSRDEAVEVTLSLPPQADRPVDERSWTVAAAAIGPLGDVSTLTRAVVPLDATPPPLALEAPFLSPPWPLAARLTGRTEPGATTVEVGGVARPVEPDGTFSLDARLAPWPQPVEVRARDRAGNETVVRVEVVGGLDYRRLPWIPILLVSLLGAAVVGTRRPVRVAELPPPSGFDDDARPVLEELTAGPIRRRPFDEG
jgi:hypothetical protein